MKDFQSTNTDFSTLLFLLLAIVAATGFSSAGAVIGSKDDAIATQKQQIQDLEQRLIESEARFEGYQIGQIGRR